jgi:hypothetical protein
MTEWRSTMAMKLKTKNDGKNQMTALPYLARHMSKWFYDTLTGPPMEAARCGSFVWRGLWSLGC